MAIAGQWNFELDQGADYNQAMIWVIGGTPVAMAGFSAKMQLRSSADSPGVAAEFNTSDNSITLHATNGTITFHKSAAQTAAIPAGIYDYDLIITNMGAVPTRKLEGKFTVNAEVTR